MKNKKIFYLLAVLILITTAVFIIHGIGESGGSGEADASQTEEITAPLSIPSNFEAYSETESSLSLRWSPSENATGYKLQLKKDGKYVTCADTKKTSFLLKELKSGKVYSLRLRAYSENEKSGFIYLKACTKPAKVNVSSVTGKRTTVNIKWKKKNTSGYQLQYSTDSDFSDRVSRTINDPDTTEYTVKKLKTDKTYYFRLRTYRTFAGKKYYSKWTKFNIKTKPKGQFTSKGYSIEVIKGKTYVDGVLIANKTYSVPKDYNPGGLTKECRSAFDKMRSAAAKEGINLYIISGFRSYETQKRLYNNYVAKDGKALADTYSARPGTSEHQTGLAMDLNSLQTSFGNTKEGKWLAKNCHKYGFIIRYPKGKQSITGYIYEPWHVRYLGKEKAAAIYKSGLCLEEYYGITSKYK